MGDKLRVGFVGFGLRGYLVGRCAKIPGIEIASVCDLHTDRVERMAKLIESISGKRPHTCTNHKVMIEEANLDAVIICTSWSSHIPLSIDFMKAGIPVGCEVGGCDNLNQIWELVRCYRQTGTEFMMLENCCYGRQELMALNMVKKGLFGEVVYCKGGYVHHLCDEILSGKEKKHYRLNNYIHRNCDNYPTHALGPIAKVLNINHGNRFLTLTSMSSKAVGLNSYASLHNIENKDLINQKFNQGDVVNTTIKCANGEIIDLTLATTTPSFGSRYFCVSGTKAFYDQNTKSLFMEGDGANLEEAWDPNMGNEQKYMDKYDHPIWQQYKDAVVEGGHGGKDNLVLRAFFESVKNGTKPPIDVYDAAAWMAVTPLSEMSIATGGKPVSFPDFTYGEWIESDTESRGAYTLNTIEELPKLEF